MELLLLKEYMLQDLSCKEGSMVFPEKGTSGMMRVPMRVFEGKQWKMCREGEDTAMMSRDGWRGRSGFGFEKTMKGEGRGCSGGEAKLLRSSWKNLEGGGCSVSTSSIFS